MDGEIFVTLFATVTLIFAMWYSHKLNKKNLHHT